MKYGIPLGALLILGFAAGFHRAGVVDPVHRVERSAPEAKTVPAPEPMAFAKETRPAVVQTAAESPKPGQQNSPAGPKAAGAPAWRVLSGTLASQLTLSSLQRESVDRILRERAEEIRACHEEIRKARLLDMRHYEWKVGRMKESWFLKIDGLLDSDQHRRFVAIVEQGFFNEGLGITEEPGMTVLD